MFREKSDAQMLALFIISELSDEVTLPELQSILVASAEIDPMQVKEYIEELGSSGQIYITKENERDELPNAKYDARIDSYPLDCYTGITQAGIAAVQALSDKKVLFKGAINRALREYKRLLCGIEYRISIENEKGGSYVKFSMFVSGTLYFDTSLFFTRAKDALEVYRRMDDDPEGFYNGFLTVATGRIDYLS